MKIKELASRRNLGRAAALAACLTVIGTAGSLGTVSGVPGTVSPEQTDILSEGISKNEAADETVTFSGSFAERGAINAAAQASKPDEVEYVHRTRKKPVAFDTIYREDPTLAEGDETVLVNGIEGEMTVDTLVTVLNGKESSVKTVSEVVTKAPVNKVVLVGASKKGNSAPSETTAPEGEETAETSRWKPLPLWQTKPDGTDVKIVKGDGKDPAETMPVIPARTAVDAMTGLTSDITSAVSLDAPAQISHFAVPDWVKFDENGRPLNYVTTHTGKACAYTANPGALMSTGNTVFQGYVAVDPRIIPYGSELYIVADDGDVYGYAIAGDTGYSVRAGDIIVDLFMNEYSDCIQWGNKHVTIYVLNENTEN